MKINFLILSLFCFIQVGNLVGQSKSPLQHVREDLFYSEFDYNKCLAFYDRIKEIPTTPTVIAYQAAAEALIAKHSWNPIIKIQYLNSAKETLAEAVNLEERNIEIRFLRFYIENSLPSYLGKNQNSVEDKKVMIENIQTLKEMGLGLDLMNYIVGYITSPSVSNTEEIALIRKKMELE